VDEKATGSVNTVKIIDGHTEGYSTDGPGFLEAFKLQTGTTVEKKSIFIFGAGGSAAAIAYACIKAGSEEIYIANRSYENTEKLCNRLNPNICTPLHLDWEEYRRYIKFSSIIINTTPLGMLGKEEFSPMRDSQKLSPHQIVYDIVYNPSVTTFMLQGIKNECPTFNGLGMLIMQAILSYQIWTENKPLPEKILIELFNSILVDLQKIIREAEEKQ
jgi:shikimate dehydrogenase